VAEQAAALAGAQEQLSTSAQALADKERQLAVQLAEVEKLHGRTILYEEEGGGDLGAAGSLLTPAAIIDRQMVSFRR
jgi:hypothetical protein